MKGNELGKDFAMLRQGSIEGYVCRSVCFQNPIGPPFDRWGVNVIAGASGLLDCSIGGSENTNEILRLSDKHKTVTGHIVSDCFCK